MHILPTLHRIFWSLAHKHAVLTSLCRGGCWAPHRTAKSSWEESTLAAQGASTEKTSRPPSQSSAGSEAGSKQGLSWQRGVQRWGLGNHIRGGEGREGRPEGLCPAIPRHQPRGARALLRLTFRQSPRAQQTAGGGSGSFKRFCLTSCRLHTFPHLPSQEKDFNNELLRDNRPLINSLLFFWGQIILIKVGGGGACPARALIYSVCS